MTLAIDRDELAGWCLGILAKYPPADVHLFIIRLKRTYDEGRR